MNLTVLRYTYALLFLQKDETMKHVQTALAHLSQYIHALYGSVSPVLRASFFTVMIRQTCLFRSAISVHVRPPYNFEKVCQTGQCNTLQSLQYVKANACHPHLLPYGLGAS